MDSNKRIAFFSGAGLGLTVGLFMGLTVSPVVGVVIGAIASSLAIFLGFGDGEHTQIKSIRIGAFGLIAALSALLGLYIRANNLLAPSLQQLKAEYIEVGFSEEEALSFLKFKEFGIIDESWRMAGGDSAAISTVQAGTSLLFNASRVSKEKCDKFEFDEFTPLKIIINNLTFLDDEWKIMTEEVIKNFPDEKDQRDILIFLSDYICDDRLNGAECSALNSINDQSDLPTVQQAFRSIGEVGNEIVNRSSELTRPMEILMLLKNTLCDDK
ncbi:hypothetical protein [Roseivirga sp. E12]|uniref:hypothetical protein n=1 Tax=Roseivirga sp. E12 TaxID=2819237 RepID=UPI001ABD39AA|nr:hypothetical protein [Roseivirga sp. E12]MBO3697399.1 hypothetical protein [Roseivirga sp. E12]